MAPGSFHHAPEKPSFLLKMRPEEEHTLRFRTKINAWRQTGLPAGPSTYNWQPRPVFRANLLPPSPFCCCHPPRDQRTISKEYYQGGDRTETKHNAKLSWQRKSILFFQSYSFKEFYTPVPSWLIRDAAVSFAMRAVALPADLSGGTNSRKTLRKTVADGERTRFLR